MPKSLHPDDQKHLLDLIYRTVLGDETIKDVSRKIGINRNKAHALLRHAEAENIIETTVVLEPDPNDKLAYLVRAACREYGVEDVVVLPSPADDRELDTVEYRAYLRRSLGSLAARYVERLTLPPRSHICVGGGRTMASFARRFSPSVRELVIRPLASGARWRTTGHADSAAVVQVLQSRLQPESGQGISVLCPELGPGEPADTARRPEVRAVFGTESPRPNVTVCAIGRRRYVATDDPKGFGPHPDTSSYVQLVALDSYYRKHAPRLTRKKKLSEADLELFYSPLRDEIYESANNDLRKKGIIGDICRHGINRGGNVVETPLQRASLAISPARLRDWREAGTNTIMVLGGSRLAPVLRAALLGRYFRTLVIDEALATQLIPIEERPEPYRHIPVVEETAD